MHVIVAPTLQEAVRHLNQMEGVTRNNAVWRDLEGNSIKPITTAEQLRGLEVSRLTVLNPDGFNGLEYMALGRIAEGFAEDVRVEAISNGRTISLSK